MRLSLRGVTGRFVRKQMCISDVYLRCVSHRSLCVWIARQIFHFEATHYIYYPAYRVVQLFASFFAAVHLTA